MLREFYRDSILQAKSALKSKYPLTICSPDDCDYPKNISSDHCVVFEIVTNVLGEDLSLVVAFPQIFPDNIPKIYLSKHDYDRLKPLPHVDANRFVCTRDPEAVFNQQKIGKATIQLVEIATREIIERGIKKENTDEIIGEFLAYWHDDCTYCFLSIIDIPKEITQLSLFELSSRIFGSQHVIAHTKLEAENWMEPLEVELKDISSNPLLHLPLNAPIGWPLPGTNQDIFELLKKNGGEFLQAAEKFFNKNDSNSLILFSFLIENVPIWGAWSHKPWASDVAHGWPTKKLPIALRFARTGNLPIEKIRVERLDKHRIFQRVGLEISQHLDESSVAIIGCGSLGSPLAVSLSKCGMSNFLLVDKEIVGIENSARHVCGIFEAARSLNKAQAIRLEILRHFPFMNCSAYDRDILTLLSKNEKLLDTCDLTVIATGHKGVERRVNQLLLENVINTSLLYIWMEPFGVAGQMLYISRDSEGCYDCCFDSDGKYRYSVAKFNSAFFKRETGCQSTFIPYSNVSIEQFISNVARVIVDIIHTPPEKNQRITWIGDIEVFQNMGFEIEDRWVTTKPFTLTKYSISKDIACDICRNSGSP
jgi:molybdopterin/thiamine biosynthesis adenylyltransferase